MRQNNNHPKDEITRMLGGMSRRAQWDIDCINLILDRLSDLDRRERHLTDMLDHAEMECTQLRLKLELIDEQS